MDQKMIKLMARGKSDKGKDNKKYGEFFYEIQSLFDKAVKQAKRDNIYDLVRSSRDGLSSHLQKNWKEPLIEKLLVAAKRFRIWQKSPPSNTFWQAGWAISKSSSSSSYACIYSFKCASRLRLMKEKTSISSIIKADRKPLWREMILIERQRRQNHNGTNWSIFTPRFRASETESCASIWRELSSNKRRKKTSTDLRHFFMMFIFATLLWLNAHFGTSQNGNSLFFPLKYYFSLNWFNGPLKWLSINEKIARGTLFLINAKVHLVKILIAKLW